MNNNTYSEHQTRAGAPSSHAVVIGGSLAGLLTARVLSDHFSRVTVIERDHYPEAPEARRGVPQAYHLHALLQRGKQILERFFPGLCEELAADGAPVLDVANDVAWLTPGGWGRRFRSKMSAISFSRSLLDWHVRRRVREIPNVAFIEGCDVEGLVAEGGAVKGVCLRFDDEGGKVLPADLVVDASGRRSRAPKWLESLGFAAPPETVINARLGYASRLYRGVGSFKLDGLDAAGAFIQAAPPHHKRGGIIFPIEDGLWILTVVGGGGDYPPSDEAGFLEFVRSLRSPIIYDAIKTAVPVTPVHTYRATENRRRHYEQLARMPERFLVIGDAACAFNPVYGQGMSTAAIGAEALAALLDKRRGDLKGLGSRFQRELAARNSAPWTMATGEDCRYEGTEGGRVDRKTRFMHGYMDYVMQLSSKDVNVRRVLLEAFNLLIAPTALFRPSILFKVIAQALRSEKAPAATAPAKYERTRQKAAGQV